MTDRPDEENPSAREKLLRDTERLLLERGRLSDLTLRKLAALLGTSHRMLIYHFGSRDGLLAALLTAVRREEQEALRGIERAGGYAEALRMIERVFLDPAARPRITAFFYVLGLAAQDPSTYREFLVSLNDWTTAFTSLGVRDGLPERVAKARADAAVWTMRGLAIMAITAGDPHAALAEYREVLTQLGIHT